MNIHGKSFLSFRMFRLFPRLYSVHLSCLLFTLLTFLTTPAESALVKFKYDPAGNMVSEQGKYYEYNDANQLVRVRKDSPTGEIIAEYVYDYQGQRVKKTENGVITYYIGKHYEERKGDTVDEKTSYFFANSQRVAKSTQKNKGSPELSYYLNNHLGSADVIINEQGGQTDRLRYLPFGGYRTFPQERHTFTGKERDEVTDNYYFEARYYNPNIRRFTQADTIIPDLYDPQSLNRYSYVEGNPLAFIDPTGHNRVTNWLVEKSRNLSSKTGPYVMSARDKSVEYTGKAWSSTKNASSKAWDGTKSASNTAWNGTKSAASRSGNRVKSSLRKSSEFVGNKIKNKINNFSVKKFAIKQGKKDLISTTADGISAAFGADEDIPIPFLGSALLGISTLTTKLNPYGAALYMLAKPLPAGSESADIPCDGCEDSY